MRKVTVEQAIDEVKVLDSLGNALQGRLRDNYSALRRPGENDSVVGDMELAAGIHNIRVSLNEAFEEIGRRGYARVALLREVDESGKFIKEEIFRLSQANAGFPEARILARNNPIGSHIASCRAGEEIEISFPGRERYFVVQSTIDLEGMTPLLRSRPEVQLARFVTADNASVDSIRGLRSFVEGLAQSPSATLRSGDLVNEADPPSPPPPVEPFWPTDWTSAILGNEDNAALGSQFFTRTTRQQERAIQAVRGVTVVQGVAGTGKTSVALGRLKFFANFRSGEHLADYGLNPNDWADFNASDMVGFVLSPSLVQYLKQTAEDLELTGLKVLDFGEFSNQERQSRKLYNRPFKRSSERNDELQRSLLWLLLLDESASDQLADSLDKILNGPLERPDTADGGNITAKRWDELQEELWRVGPLRGRLIGLVRHLRATRDSPKKSFKLQGFAKSIELDVRFSERETLSLSLRERRAMGDALQSLTIRLYRLLNPAELYVAAYENPLLEKLIAESFSRSSLATVAAANRTAKRLKQRLISEDDIVSTLCLNSITCDGFEREIAGITYLRTYSDRVAVFIDEYQDFSEQQMLLMSSRARPKYRQITAAGDASQRLHQVGISDINRVFPSAYEVRQIFLTDNLRQTAPLARFSRRIRSFTNGEAAVSETPCRFPLHVFQSINLFADLASNRIAELPEAATVAVITPTRAEAEIWFEAMSQTLEAAFRNPILSDRARLTERFRTHFATPLDVKGLEFDAVVIPDVSSFAENDAIAMNGLYVAVSRPRFALFIGCQSSKKEDRVIAELIKSADVELQAV